MDETVGRVVTAGGLAGVAAGFVGGGKAELATVAGELGDQFEETFVDAAEFLGAHIAPVDPGKGAVVAEPGELEKGKEQGAILELGGVEIRALMGSKETGEGGQAEAGFALGEAAQDDLERLPEIREAIVGAALQGTLAEAAEGVAIGVESERRMANGERWVIRPGSPFAIRGSLFAFPGMQQTALLNREQEDQPIHEPEELGEIVAVAERALAQGGG